MLRREEEELKSFMFYVEGVHIHDDYENIIKHISTIFNSIDLLTSFFHAN